MCEGGEGEGIFTNKRDSKSSIGAEQDLEPIVPSN